MKLEEFLQVKVNSENIGKETIAANIKQFRFHDYDAKTAEDSFAHLIYTVSFSLTTSCSYELTMKPCYHFLCIYEGSMAVTCEGGETFLGTADRLLFLPPAKNYQFQIRSGKCRFFQCGLLGAVLSTYARLLPHNIPYTKSESGASCLPDTILHLQNHKTQNTTIDTIVYSKWINDIFTELCVYAEDSTKLRNCVPSYLMQIKKLFDEHYQENYTLDALEQKFDKSRYRLCREFSHYFGQSPIQYLNHRRIREAKVLLLSTNLSVHEVGSAVGIENTNHFINLFKKETGATPLVFKQEAPVSLSELHYPCSQDAHPQ